MPPNWCGFSAGARDAGSDETSNITGLMMKRLESEKKINSMTGLPLTKPRGMMIAMWAVLIMIVFIAITNLLPLGGVSISRGGRKERKQLDNAKRMEGENLWNAAAKLYQDLADDMSVTPATRAKAAGALVSIYTDKLPDPEKALHSLETAYFFETDE